MTGFFLEGGPPPPAYNSIFCLLDTPIVFDLIVGCLDTTDRAILSLTCRDLRSRFSSIITEERTQSSLQKGVSQLKSLLDITNHAIITLTRRNLSSRSSNTITKERARPSLREHLGRLGFLEYQSLVARDLPDEYVCKVCAQLHRSDSRTDGHVHDVRVVEQMSKAKISRSTAELALVAPCQRLQPMEALQSKFWRVPLRLTKISPGIIFTAGAGAYDGYLHTFTGALSSARRAPLSGLLHRDVQLLLKRARLLKDTVGDNKGCDHAHTSYGSKLHIHGIENDVRHALAPFQAERLMERHNNFGVEYKDVFSYHFTPRVVLVDNMDDSARGHQKLPRFLLKTVLTLKDSVFIHIPFCICPHQLAFHHESPGWLSERQMAWGRVAPADVERFLGNRVCDGIRTPEIARAVRPQEMQLASILQYVGEMRTQDWDRARSDEETLKRLVEDTNLCKQLLQKDRDRRRRETPGFGLSGSCHRCPTDFHVYSTNRMSFVTDELTITVWQDFGPEAPVTDELWQSHLPGFFLQAECGKEPYTQPNTWQSGPSVAHRAGSVREAFETAPPYL